MATTEQFSLRWNNFHSNLTSGFHELLQAADMVDVTLAVDGHFLQAHKIVLSICSPYFKQMFKANPCKHPIVILKDVGHENMKDILQFMYMGEVSVLRDNLSSFLRTAEVLQVKGLTGDDPMEESSAHKTGKSECDNDDSTEIYNELIESADVELPTSYSGTPPQTSPLPLNVCKRPPKSSNTLVNAKKSKCDQRPVKHDPEHQKQQPDHHGSDVGELQSSPDRDDHKEHVKSPAIPWENNLTGIQANSGLTGDPNYSDQGRSNGRVFKNGYQCEQCLKKFSRRDHLRTHEKNIHGSDAGPFKCVICEQLYKNTESLRKHIAKFHFSNINEMGIKAEVKI
ncbi:zinc finger protein 131-like isoform X1 [Cylas formicarius]|uniref:zinc finger protein 131-like isoform X1 n=1 Tax=Cylas formicarius TaxID=197179 RepID=UPI002958C64E|nr:zinc finger protein 131-like isoform X1 [Cylas formicarius]